MQIHLYPFVPGSYKHWWDNALPDLKERSIDAHKLWKICGCPRSGDIFSLMKQAEIAYKQAIKAHRTSADTYISNELHDLLMEKDMINFWKSWNAKFPRNVNSKLVDGTNNSQIIATKFANLFQQNCQLSKPSSKDHTISSQLQSYVNNSDMSDLKLFDVETVCQCLSQMKKGKAPCADGTEAEHLVYAH